MKEIKPIGMKIGSQITAIACRDDDGKIDITSIKTCVRYSNGFFKKGSASFGYTHALKLILIKTPVYIFKVSSSESAALF